jgi:hypothetical protein
MTTSARSRFAALLIVAALPAAAAAQDVQPPTGPPFEASLSAPASVPKAKLKKGFTVTVRCAVACNARLMFAGQIGIVTTTSGDVPSGVAKTFKIKAQPFQIRAMKKGTTYTLSLDARSAEDGGGQDSRKIRIR